MKLQSTIHNLRSLFSRPPSTIHNLRSLFSLRRSTIHNLRSNLGFTLIELLVVIAIIGILATIVLTNVQGVRERARDYRRKSDLNSIAQSLRLYYSDYKSFPASSSYAIQGCGPTNNLHACAWGTEAFAVTNNLGTATLATYMSKLPLDPQSGATNTITYQYERPSSDQYIIVAKLENKSDSDAAASQARCASAYSSFAGTKTSQDYVVCAE